MGQIWINDRFFPEEQATFPAQERAFFFGDGVYEVYRLYQGHPFTRQLHLERFYAGCRELELVPSYPPPQLLDVLAGIEATVKGDSVVYFQLSRGAGRRRHDWNDSFVTNFMGQANPMTKGPTHWYAQGIKTITARDNRWSNCHIKSLNLLANCQAMTKAARIGAYEPILIREDNYVTEAAASSIFAVIDGTLRTASLRCNILPGITRHLVLELARQHGVPVVEQAFALGQLQKAEEAFLTNTPYEILPIRQIDENLVSQSPGPITRHLMDLYSRSVEQETGVVGDCAVGLL